MDTLDLLECYWICTSWGIERTPITDPPTKLGGLNSEVLHYVTRNK